MPSWIKNPKIVVPGVLGVAALLWLAFGFFGVHLLFTEDRAAEAPPVFDAGTSADGVVTEFSGSFVGLDHPTSGQAIVLGNGTGQRFLRLEAFETDNGPDLDVYLVNSAAGGVEDAIVLGDLKGNIGDQNYEIPEGVDLSVYDTVVVWCVRFSSPFGEATLAPA
ncbi:MAG: hypothetical protein F2534_17580 [Actinobacteria bacterium]|uniref:Unannotated protein n=1 Tax=freshwater metagenome TaxID=449393 RepID=A0A6J6FBK4_9ZZZZ|nr:hypothetical protein [Actinomycetota bacterium]